MYSNELREIERLVEKHARKKKVEEHFTRCGLAVPQTRTLIKNKFSFSDYPPAAQLKIWDFVWKNSHCYEAMSLCIYAFQNREISKPELTKIKTWLNRCHCWEHSDDLSKIFAAVVESKPDWILPILREWNKAKSPWKRRQSVVSLLEYASKRRSYLPFAEMISFIDPLLADPEYYVQKGVGWTIREVYKVYPKEMLRYLEKNLLRIQPLAYSAATEKLPKAVKAGFNAARKQNRRS